LLYRAADSETPRLDNRERTRQLCATLLNKAVRHLPHAVVREVQALTHGVQDAAADQCFHSARGALLAQP
jgi:hypothetical protein